MPSSSKSESSTLLNRGMVLTSLMGRGILSQAFGPVNKTLFWYVLRLVSVRAGSSYS